MLPIVERFFLHFVCSFFFYALILVALSFWARKNQKAAQWLGDLKPRMVISALLVGLLFPLRELWDLFANNNTIVKGYFDIASWILGGGSSAFLMYRVRGIK